MRESMILVIFTALCFGAAAVALAVLEKKLVMLTEKVRTLETAFSAVKPALDEYPKLANEVRDMRETLDELPVEDITAAAAYEKAYAESLEAINNYSVAVAMKGGGE